MSLRRNSIRDEWDQLRAKYPERLAGWTLVFNSRMRSVLGRCKYRRKEIHVAEWHRKQHAADEVRDTFLHEVAHALAGRGTNHGPEWKRWCLRIGARPERLASEVGPNRRRKAPKWLCECESCGKQWTRRRRVSDWHGRVHVCERDGDRRGRILWLDRRSGQVFRGKIPYGRRRLMADFFPMP